MSLSARTARTTAQRLAAALSVGLALSLALSLVAVTEAATTAAAGVPQDEAAFVDLINHSRWEAGNGPLTGDPAAANVARAWSQRMAGAGQISHNPNLAAEVSAWVTSQWSRIGENVGVGYGVSSLHDAFMASSGHRANILGDYNRVGVGVVHSGGRMWVTVVFIKGPAIAPPAPVWSAPIGALDLVQQLPGSVRVAGWSLDPDTAASNDVHVYVDSTGVSIRADRPRGDIGSTFPGYGDAHGFELTMPLSPGGHNVCAYGINAASGGGNTNLGCRYVYQPSAPFGSVDGVWWSAGKAAIFGWTVDAMGDASIDAHVYVDGVGVATRADQNRPDVASALPGYGSAHGFGVQIPMTGGHHSVCVFGIGRSANTLLNCRTVELPTMPVGTLDYARRVPGGVEAGGWAFDPETSEPIDVHLWAGPVGASVAANGLRADVANAFPGMGDRHGFVGTVNVDSSPVQLCAFAIGTGAGGNTLIGCRTL